MSYHNKCDNKYRNSMMLYFVLVKDYVGETLPFRFLYAIGVT